MAKQRKTVGLITFLKGNTDPDVGMPGCANYDHHHGGCLFCWAPCLCTNDECLPCVDFEPYTYCKVERGERCWYFEKAVLPTSQDIGLSALVYSLYEKQVGHCFNTKHSNRPVRRCPGVGGQMCGAALPPRKRYCSSCKNKSRRETYRRSKEKNNPKEKG